MSRYTHLAERTMLEYFQNRTPPHRLQCSPSGPSHHSLARLDYCNSFPTGCLLPLLPPYRLLSTQEPDQALLVVRDKVVPWPTWPSPSPHSLLCHLLLLPPRSFHRSHTGLLAIPPSPATFPPQGHCACSSLHPFRWIWAWLTPSTIPVLAKQSPSQ